MNNRVVITGAGVVSSLGEGIDQCWDNLIAGRSGLRPVSRFDTSAMPCHIAGEVYGFEARNYMPARGLDCLNRATLFTCAAAKMAISNARLELSEFDASGLGISLGTAFGGAASMGTFDDECLRDGPKFIDPMIFPQTVTNSPAGHLSILLGTSGSNLTVSTGLASGLDAIQLAAKAIKTGELQIAITGGYDELAREVYVKLAGEKRLSGSQSDDKEKSVPLDRNRNGFFLSEGAGVLVLESLDSALARNAPILAELSGFSSAFCLSPSQSAHVESKAIANALDASEIHPSDVSYVSLSASGSVEGDKDEGIAIENVFGSYSSNLPVTAIKSMIGECGGAAGAIQVIAAALSTQFNLIPPTREFQSPDPMLSLQGISSLSQRIDCKTVLVNSFNGLNTNSSFVVKRLT